MKDKKVNRPDLLVGHMDSKPRKEMIEDSVFTVAFIVLAVLIYVFCVIC